jgi:hypothetical protein
MGRPDCVEITVKRVLENLYQVARSANNSIRANEILDI